MSLREEMARYEQLTGESAEHIPIIKIGAFLDGVDKGIEELEEIRNEITMLLIFNRENVVEVIDNHIAELKGEQK